MIVGVAGRNGAGKGEVIRLLEQRGFAAHSLSDVIREVLRERGLEESRELMIETGRELRQQGGPGILGERLLGLMDPARDHAVDSVRHPAEVEALRAGGQKFLLLWVEADEARRFDRMVERGRSGDPETIERLRELEGRELGSADPAAQQLDAVRAISDTIVKNNRDLDELKAAVEAALAS
jgi:dephospho-CoA kinase